MPPSPFACVRRVPNRDALSRAVSPSLAPVGISVSARGDRRRHKRTRPFRPQTNGKAERFNKTLLAEWAYLRRYDTNQARLDVLPDFVERYNQRRSHGSLNGESPMTVLVNNVSGNHS
jgi:transposase InsO family protein